MNTNYRPHIEAAELDISVDISEVMRQVYMWMTGGLLITAFVSSVVASTGLWRTLANPIVFIGAIIAEFALIIYLSARITRLGPGKASLLFALFSAINGLTLSLIFVVYTSGDIALAFISTAAMFAAMSIVGYTTKADLSKLGAILFMGVIGLIITMLLNAFLHSDGLYWLVSILGVIIFTGLTAYDTQKIKMMATQSQMLSIADASVMTRSIAIFGAMILYLDFINLFLFILRLLGGKRR